MDSPSISVVVACYNKKETITNCIKSILDQNHDGYELIIVNDGSDDGSDQAIQHFNNNGKVKIINTAHKGVSAAKNSGIENSNGNIILFIDGDCEVDSNVLKELSNSFGNSSVACVGGEVRSVNGHNILTRTVESMQNDVERKWPFGANVAYTREVLNKAGGYDERMENGEDAELFLKIIKLGYKYSFNPHVKVRTVNPDTVLKFFKQRFRWGTGFAQLTERHPDIFTRRIKLCFALTITLLTSPFLAFIDARLILVFAIALVARILMIFPLSMKLSTKARDRRYYLLVPFLGLTNALGYFLGFTYWKILELVKLRVKLEAFQT